MPVTDLAGQRFGKLFVVEGAARDGYGRARWRCMCDCGTGVVVAANNLKTGNTAACGGCRSAHNKLPPGTSAFNCLIWRYKLSAKKRGIAWGLDSSEFQRLTKEPCSYCASPPAQTIRNGRDIYVFNGVDRISSASGYVHGNVAACCKTCNYAKGTMELEAFRAHVARMFAKMFGGSNG